MIKPSFKSFEELTPYQQGLSEVEGVKRIIKLSSNENPFQPLSNITKAIKAGIKDLNRYPDGSAKGLRKAISKKYDIDFDNIIIGAGSDEIISLICRAFATEGDEVVYSEHGFAMYPLYALTSGAKAVAARENNYKSEVSNIIKAITKKTKVIFLANPNNPTGSYLSRVEIEQLLAKVPKTVLVVLDNAYFQYATAKDYSPCFDLVEKHANLCILNTFSKIYGIAALRLGYGYFSKEIAVTINKIRSPFSVSNLSLKAGEACLENNKFLKKSIEHNTKWREIVFDEFKSLGLKPYKSECNFIMVKFPSVEKAQGAFDALFKQGIILRNLKAYKIPDSLRMTIGSAQDNKTALEAVAKVLGVEF
jgi:histidinol-phosphate aminotransferase